MIAPSAATTNTSMRPSSLSATATPADVTSGGSAAAGPSEITARAATPITSTAHRATQRRFVMLSPSHVGTDDPHRLGTEYANGI
jgi:hypothetical protein